MQIFNSFQEMQAGATVGGQSQISVFNAMDESLITPEMFYNIQDARKELVAMNNTFGFIGEPGVEEAYETIQTYLSTLSGKARAKAGDVNDAGEIVPRVP